MIKTSIILELDGRFPVEYKYSGLAKNLKELKWLFEFCGWKTDDAYPCYAFVIEEGVLHEEIFNFPCDMTQLWVLGDCMYLN